MCHTKEFVHPTSGRKCKLYSFDLSLCLEHFAVKYDKIRRHLAQRYVDEQRGLLLHLRREQSQRRGIIKQEPKGLAVKTEGVKSETLKTEEMEIDVAEYEERFEVMAMGVVADELP